MPASQPPNAGPDHEAEAERHADQAEGAGALLGGVTSAM